MKLSTKILISLVSSTLAVLVVGGLFIYNSTQQALEDSISLSQQSLARKTLDTVDVFLHERYLDIQTIATGKSLAESLGGQLTGVEISQKLKEFQNTTGPWDELTVFDRQGVLKGTTNVSNAFSKKETNTSLLQAIEYVFTNNTPYYGDAELVQITGKPSVLFAAPIRDVNKINLPIIGVVIGQMSWSALQDIIGHDESRISRMHNSKGQLIFSSVRQEKKILFSETHLAAPGVAESLAGNDFAGFVTRNNANYFLSAVPELGYLSYKGHGWSLEIEVPSSIAFASAKSTALNILLVLIPILLIGSIYTFFLVLILVIKPINALAETSKKIAAGNLNIQAEVSSSDEVGLLAGAFNTMTGSLRELNSGLEQKVKVRTEELSKLSLVVEKTDNIVVITDKHGLTEWVNSAFTSLTGYSLDEVKGKKPGEVLQGPETDPEDKKLFSNNIAKKVSFSGDILNYSKSGRKYMLRADISPVVDDSGEVQKFIAIERDITEEIEAKANLVSLTQRLELATRSAKIGVWEWDIDKNALVWDRRMFSLYGIEQAEQSIAYDVWKSGLHPEDAKETEKLLNDTIVGKREYETQFRVVWPDKSIHHIRAYGIPIRNNNGKVVKMVGVNFDVTKEHAVDQAKTEFVSLASHQLRTPLSAINWYTEMLLAGDAGAITDDQKNYLEEIYHGNQRMVDLVNALLNVSRMELGTFIVEPEPTNIIQLAQDVVKEQNPQITQRKIQLTVKFAKDIPVMQVDPKLLRMVFQNLLSNSVKYTPEGGAVTMSIQRDDKDNAVAITVADTGYGIPKEQHDKIFSKLFRADNVREQDTDGTGLGLYIVKSIVEQSNGKIWFESEKDKGTTFHVTLPLAGMKKKSGTKAMT